MRHQVTRVSVLQTSKIIAILYALFGLLLVPVGCMVLALGAEDSTYTLLGVFYLLGPVLYGVLGFVFTAIGIWIYNLVAGRIGGIEFELKEVPSTTTS